MAAVKKTDATAKTYAEWEAERKAMAKQIHDFNVRLTIEPSAQKRIDDLEAINRRLGSVIENDARRWDERVKEHADVVRDLTAKLAAASNKAMELREQLEAAREQTVAYAADDREPIELDMDEEIDALTDVIRAAKAIRRRWRG